MRGVHARRVFCSAGPGSTQLNILGRSFGVFLNRADGHTSAVTSRRPRFLPALGPFLLDTVTYFPDYLAIFRAVLKGSNGFLCVLIDVETRVSYETLTGELRTLDSLRDSTSAYLVIREPLRTTTFGYVHFWTY
jgi:hypothetical protein